MQEKVKNKQKEVRKKRVKSIEKQEKGITLIALVITIVLNFSYLEMARVNRFEKI